MNNFRRFALLTTTATYFLIFVGGLVRVAGAGLGCPDWPKCFGRWIPPLSIDQIPDNIDPANFNVVLAWIEYTNRLAGMSIGILILITAFLAFRHYRNNSRVLYPSLAAAILVAVEGWQGSIVVATELQPLVVTVHMVLALVIVSLLLFATLESHRTASPVSEKPISFPRHTRSAVAALWGLTMLQIIAGSQVRQALEVAIEKYPLFTPPQWLIEAGAMVEIHSLGGLVIASLTFYVALSLMRSEGRRLAIVKIPAILLCLLVLGQILLGSLLQTLELSPLVANLHLWLAATILSLQLILFSAVKTPNEFQADWKRSMGRLAGMIGAMTIVIGVAAWGVIGKAERSLHDIPVLASQPNLINNNQDEKISILFFVKISETEATKEVMREMRDLYFQYEHSDVVRFVLIDLDSIPDTNSTLIAYFKESGIDKDRWDIVAADSERWTDFGGLGIDLASQSDECCDQFALIDAVGDVRGLYHFSSVASVRQFETDIRVLVRSLE